MWKSTARTGHLFRMLYRPVEKVGHIILALKPSLTILPQIKIHSSKIRKKGWLKVRDKMSFKSYLKSRIREVLVADLTMIISVLSQVLKVKIPLNFQLRNRNHRQ